MWHNEKAPPALPRTVSDTLRKGATWMKYPMSDPWPNAPNRAIGTYLSSDERGVVERLFEAGQKRAEEVLAHDRAGKPRRRSSAGVRSSSAASRATAERGSPQWIASFENRECTRRPRRCRMRTWPTPSDPSVKPAASLFMMWDGFESGEMKFLREHPPTAITLIATHRLASLSTEV